MANTAEATTTELDSNPPVIVIDTANDDLTNEDFNKLRVTHDSNNVFDSGTASISPRIDHKQTLKVPTASRVTLAQTPQPEKESTISPSKSLESLDNGGSPKRKRHRSKEEELKHLTEDDLLVAQTLIQDAKQGRNFIYKMEPEYIRYYIWYHKWYFRWTLYFCIFINLLLALIEKPTRSGWEVQYWATMIIELLCLTFFIVRVVHSAYFIEPRIFWRDEKNIMVIGIIALTVLDMICYIIWVNVAPFSNPVRWSRPLRSLLIINFSDGKQIRRAFRNIRRTLPEIIHVLVLFILNVLLFAFLTLKLFGRRSHLIYPNGASYFKNYPDSFWDLYVLVTTANYPDVMMPAYDENNWFAILFIVYLVICLYIFMSIVLAVIYNSYRDNLKAEIRQAVFSKRRKLNQAFAILKVERNGEEIITKTVWNTIMSRVLPNKRLNHIELLMKVLDTDSTGYINRKNFLGLVNLLQVHLSEVQERLTFLEQRFPNIYNSRPSYFIKACVRHRFFRWFFDVMIIINAFTIGFNIDDADWFFLSIFLLEILCKMYVLGPKEFFKRLWNIFDFIIIVGAFIASAFEGAFGDSGDELSTLDLLLVLRVVRLVKLIVIFRRFKIILMTIINIAPSIGTYGGVIFVLYYVFAIVGMEIFHGLVTYHGYNETNPTNMFCGNPRLNGSYFYSHHYCSNNFNDILKSFVLLFELTVVNQWDVLSSGFVIVTNKAARIYFFAFHLCCVIIVLNIFVAFILEAFIVEYSILTTGRMESSIETKIKALGLGIGQKQKPGNLAASVASDKMELVSDEQEVDKSSPVSRTGSEMQEESESDTDSIPDLSNEKGLRFHLKKKSHKSVEALLQQMFEGEINPEDDGKDEELQSVNKKVTLDSVA